MAIHSSTLAWKIPWTKEPGRLQSMGLQRVRHDWATSLWLFTFMHWKEMATHSSVLAWRIPGRGEPGGLPSTGLHRIGHDWSNLAAAAATCRERTIVDKMACSDSLTPCFVNNGYVTAEIIYSTAHVHHKVLAWSRTTLCCMPVWASPEETVASLLCHGCIHWVSHERREPSVSIMNYSQWFDAFSSIEVFQVVLPAVNEIPEAKVFSPASWV